MAAYEGWALVELMGYAKSAGRISEEEAYGTKLLRVDRPVGSMDEFVTSYHGGAAIYRITPCDEAIARQASAQMGDPRPVHPATYLLPSKEPAFAEDDTQELRF